jgi:hypothetical protein
MITRIESNCATGEIKYFDENEVEISQEIALAEIKEKIDSKETTVISTETLN